MNLKMCFYLFPFKDFNKLKSFSINPINPNYWLWTIYALPGNSSSFGSLYFTPNENAGDDSWIFLSALSTSYDPGAVKKKKGQSLTKS